MTDRSQSVRAGGEADIDAVMTIWAGSRSGHASTEDRREDLEQLLADRPGSLIVVEIDGDPAGAVIAGWDGWRGGIYRLAVLDEHRRRGIGTLLVEAAESHLRGRGCRRVTALVGRDDKRAGCFWDAAGYPIDEEVGRRVRNI